MKIREKWLGAGWYTVCILLCVRAHPTKNRFKMYFSNSKLFDPETINGYGFEEEVSATGLSEIIEDSLEEFEEKGPSTMRAITARARSKVVLLPLIIEPEAEMLPPGYKSVKPPGVSHMELALARSQTGPSGRKSATLRASAVDGKPRRFDRDGDADYAASKYETQVARDDRGSENVAVSKVDSKGDAKKESKKTEYSEASGARKSHSENEDRAKNHKEANVERKAAAYETVDDRKRAHNAAGHRNVYHKDEFKKDADFYDNGRQGGHYEKHGRYGEKHAVAEGTYAKGKKRFRTGSQ